MAWDDCDRRAVICTWVPSCLFLDCLEQSYLLNAWLFWFDAGKELQAYENWKLDDFVECCMNMYVEQQLQVAEKEVPHRISSIEKR